MKATIKDVARMAGVSPATVSRVLRGSDLVSQETKDRVKQAIKQSNYTYAKPLYSVLTNSKNTILVISGDISSTFFSHFFHSLQSNLLKSNYISLIAYSEYDEHLDEYYFEYAQRQRLAGAILVTPVESPKMLNMLDSISIPTVLVNRPLRTADLNVVCLDHYRAGYLGAQILIQNGHRRIICLMGSSKSNSDAEKLAGIRDAFQDAEGTTDDLLVIYGNYTSDGAYTACQSIKDDFTRHTAAFICNEQMTYGFINAQQQWNRKIPGDISIVSVAAQPIRYNDINVTTITQNASVVGLYAAQQIIKVIKDPEATPQKIYLPPEFHEGNTVARLTNVCFK